MQHVQHITNTASAACAVFPLCAAVSAERAEPGAGLALPRLKSLSLYNFTCNTSDAFPVFLEQQQPLTYLVSLFGANQALSGPFNSLLF